MWNTNQQYSSYGGSGGYHQSSNYSNSYAGGRSVQQYSRSTVGGSSSNYNSSTAPRVFTGHVTKLQDSFGIIDKDVFFQFSVVKGKVPMLNDKVLVEAVFNDVLPFKWHATSVQGLGPGGGSSGGGSYSAGRAVASTIQKSSNGSSYHQQPSEHLGRSSSGSTSGYGRGSQQDYSKTSRYGTSSRYDVSPEKSYSSTSYRNSSSGYESRTSGAGRRDTTYDFNSGRQDARNNIRGGGGASIGGDSRSYRYEDKRGRDYSNEKLSSRDEYDRSSRQARPVARSRTPQRETSTENNRSSYQSRKRSRSRSNDRTASNRYQAAKSRDGSNSSSQTRDRSSRERTTGESFKRVSLRYNVKPPRYALNVLGVDSTEMRRRFEGISVPSEFAHLKFSYQETFPMGKKAMGLGHLVRYHVMDPIAEDPAGKIEDNSSPEDCDAEFFVCVMLMSSQSLDYLYANCCKMSGSNSENLQHMSKVVSFLMGQKANKDIDMIGGQWSPSIDGESPRQNPAVLINTAIRVTRAQTGIDLSRCGNWYTIAELFFVKPGDKLKEEPDKLQCRVILVPDIWTLMPNESEWEQIKETYKQFGESKAMELEPPPPPSPEPTPDTTTTTSNDQEQEMLASASVNEQIFDKVMDSAEDQSNEMAEQADSSSSANEDKDTPQKETSGSAGKQALTPSSMKVTELKAELAARGLETKGLKPALVQRLEEALASDTDKSGDDILAEAQESLKSTEETPMEEDTNVEPSKDEEAAAAAITTDKEEETGASEETPDQALGDESAYEVLLPDETEALDDAEKIDDITSEDKKDVDDDKEKTPADDSEVKDKDTDAKGVSEFLKEKEDKQKEEADRLAKEIREEKERKEREEAEAAKAKAEAERIEQERKDKEEAERKEKLRKEKQQQIRDMYQLPEKPHIIVHPPLISNNSNSQTTTNSKLKTVSYSSLLDKVHAESKEDAFTLEVFAECFYEMLQRDFCYEVYRALEDAKDPEVERKKAEMARKEKEAAEAAEKARLEEEARLKKEEEERIEAERKAKEEQEQKEKEEKAESEAQEESMDTAEGSLEKENAQPNGDTKEDISEEKSDMKAEDEVKTDDVDDETAPPSSKRIKNDDSVELKTENGDHSEQNVKNKELNAKTDSDKKDDDEIQVVAVKKKMVSKTVYPQLLLAFSFFDRSFSGYIKQRDLEDCVDALGLGLSKNQLKYLVGKVSKLDLVNYQDMTDEKVEEGASYAFKYHSDSPLGNSSAYRSSSALPSSEESSGGGGALCGDYVQFEGSTINLRNVMTQADQLKSENSVLKSRVIDLEKDNSAMKSKYDNEAQESATLRKKLGETRATLSQTANSNAHLTRTQDSLKRLLKDNVSTLEDTMKVINKKLDELEPKTEQEANN